MNPDRGLLAPKKVAPGIGISMAMTGVSAFCIFRMIVAPKLASVWNSMTKSTSRCKKLSALASAVAPSRRLSAISRRMPAAAEFAFIPCSTFTQKAMLRWRLAKPNTKDLPLRGLVTAAAAFTIARRSCALNMAPLNVAGSKPWKSSAKAEAGTRALAISIANGAPITRLRRLKRAISSSQGMVALPYWPDQLYLHTSNMLD
jgi:hypothetical protein